MVVRPVKSLLDDPKTRSMAFMLGVFTLLTVAMTWPFLKVLAHSVVGQFGDNLYFIWLIGWVQEALFDLHQSPLISNLINYPEGWRLASTDSTFLMVLMALPFSLIGGPTFGYNVAILLSFVLSGFFLGIWVDRLTGSTWTGILAGAIFAFAPFRLTHYLAGHLHILGTQWLPLYFMASYEVITRSDGRRKWVLIAAIALGLIALTSQYYLYMTLILTVPFVAIGSLLLKQKEKSILMPLQGAGLILLLATPLILLAISPYLGAAAGGFLPERSVEDAARYSASISDYALPFTGHPVWGDWIGYHFDRSLWVEATLYPGVVSVSLAIVAFLKRNDTQLGSKPTLLFASIVLIALVLSMGSTLRWLSQPVSIDLPQFLDFLSPDGGGAIALPGLLMFKYLPFYDSIRVSMRYGVFVSLFTALLAAVGATWIATRLQGWLRTAVALGLAAFLIMDFLPPAWTFTKVEGRPVDRWIAAQPSSGAVAQFPAEVADSQEHLYYTLVHNQPYIGAFTKSFVTSQAEAIGPLLVRFPDPISISTLRDLGVEYLLVDGEWYSERHLLDDVQLALNEQGIKFVGAIEDQYVYILE